MLKGECFITAITFITLSVILCTVLLYILILAKRTSFLFIFKKKCVKTLHYKVLTQFLATILSITPE